MDAFGLQSRQPGIVLLLPCCSPHILSRYYLKIYMFTTLDLSSTLTLTIVQLMFDQKGGKQEK